MADSLQVELVAADRIAWSGEAQMVLTRTVDGELGIMAHHTPLLSVLATGTVEIRGPNREQLVAAVDGGFISVADNRVSILSGHVELSDEIDINAARRDLEDAEHRVASGRAEDDVDATEAMAVAQARIAAFEKAS